jgi:hypothetical protein
VAIKKQKLNTHESSNYHKFEGGSFFNRLPIFLNAKARITPVITTEALTAANTVY